jgi:hypothetical protein
MFASCDVQLHTGPSQQRAKRFTGDSTRLSCYAAPDRPPKSREMPDLLFELRSEEIPAPPGACSAAGARTRKREDGMPAEQL